jgi:hypothetical protein
MMIQLFIKIFFINTLSTLKNSPLTYMSKGRNFCYQLLKTKTRKTFEPPKLLLIDHTPFKTHLYIGSYIYKKITISNYYNFIKNSNLLVK